MHNEQVGGREGIPVIPLPNPGEGGPVSSGGSVPVIPLPNPGEGGPVDGGEGVPVVPLPNPGEGGPVYPETGGREPCYYCGIYARVRFFHAAVNYPAVHIYVQGMMVANGAEYGTLTGYRRTLSGYRTVTVAGEDGYIYLQKSLPFRAGVSYTVAIVRTASGIDLLPIDDAPCIRLGSRGCFRTVHLAYAAPAVNVLLADGRVVYSDLRYKEIPVYKQIRNGGYRFYITEATPIQPREPDIETEEIHDTAILLPETALATFALTIRSGAAYTAYVLDRTPEGGLRVVVTEDIYN